MGLFGPKKSSEEKNYEAVYKKFPSKKVGLAELEKAIADWEAAEGSKKETWKAYFKMAIACDCGRVVEMNEAKGRAYHEKVRTLIDESGDARWKKWADSFYYWYGQSAINFLHELDAQTVNIRRLGNAAINAVGLTGLGFMQEEISDTLFEQKFDCSGKAAETAGAFYEYVKRCAWKVDKAGVFDDRNRSASNFDADKEEIHKFYLRDQEEKKLNDTPGTWSDLHQYIFGLGMVLKAPLSFAYKSNNPQDTFVVRMVNMMVAGNVMALHKLVLQAFNSPEDHKFVAKTCNNMSEGALDMMLKDFLVKAEKAGDYTATELLNRYFPGQA